MNSDAENQEVLKRILRAIELATKHHNFALYFVQCQLLTDQDNYINYLKEQCNEKGVELLKVDLSSKIIKNPREEILKELNYKFPSSKPDKLTISVTGLDASFLTDVDYESPAVLQILNMGREHYARDMPYPSIFWLPDYAITKIASGAPDFWAWRSGDVDELVSSEAAKRQAINDAVRLDEPSKWDEGISQIILFERLIDGHPGSENGTDEQKREYRILQYRLGKAYHVLEMYPSAYQHYRKALEIGKGSGDLAQQGRELNALGLVCRSMGKSQKSLQYSHLFSIDVSTDAGLEEDLNKSIISEKLKHIFKNNRHSLFYNASVTKEKEDEWLITDEEKFLVKKEEGKLSIYKNFLEDSLKYFEKYFGLSVRENDKKGQGVALGNIGLVYRDVQQNEKAIGYLKRALTINKGNRYRSGVSDNLGNLGLAYQEMGDFETAIEYHLKALKVSREIGDRESEIKDLANLGVVYNSQGKIKDAIGYYQQALELSKQSEDRPRERDLPIKIAHCFRELGELDEAQDYYEEAKETCQEMGDDGNLCDVLIYQAELSHEFEETKKEIDLYEEALTLSRKLRDEEKELVCLKKLIQLHHREWDPDKAKNYIDDARKVLGNNLMAKPINVWLRDGSGRQPESLAKNQKYDLCLNIGEPDIGYSPLGQTDFIFDLVSEREVPNKPIKPFPKPSTALEEEKEEIPQPIPETYDVEEKAVKVTETPRPETISHIGEIQTTPLIPEQHPKKEPSERIHEEFSKDGLEVSVRLQKSSNFGFDKNKGQLYVSWEKDSGTFYFGITPKKIGKQSITIEGAANDIPWDLTIGDIEVEVKMSDIFISHSSEDRGKAKDIAEVLEQQGFSVWWDRSIPQGMTFDTGIEEALDAAKCVIVLWSKTSVSSDRVKINATKGNQKGIIIPVLIDDVKIPLAFRRILAADLRDWRGILPHSGFDNLLKAVEGILGRSLPVQPLTIPQGYKNWIKEFHSTMSIEKLARSGEVITVSLPEAYISLEAANPFYKVEELEKEHGTKESATIDIEELLGRLDCILLRGNAGMGKTTLIKHLANTITEGSCQSSLRDYLPVMVFLKDFWLVYREELKRTRRKITFEPLLEAYLEKIKCPLDLAVISNFIQHNRALFMFDGLDEIPVGIRDDLVELIAEFQFENKGNRFLITGRPHGIAGKPNERFGKYLREIEYLDDTKINEFIRKWFRAVSGKATGLADTTAEGMISDIVFHEHVSVFTQNPLLLAAVCVLYLAGGRIPEQRADLYDRIVENLLWRRFHDPAKPDKVNEVREFLMLLAFGMQNKNRKTFEVGDGLDVLKQICVKNEDEQAHKYQRRIKRMFNEIEPNCGLFNRLSGGEIEFTHLTFQEFMAAKQIVYMDLDYNEFLENDWWAETILLYTGLLSLEMRKRSNDVVEAILNTKQEDEKIKRRLWLLGSKALRDFSFKRNDKVVALARDKLYELIDSNASIEERFEAGENVGALGDLRVKKDNMVIVKGDKFTRGSGKDDADAFYDEKPQREIYLDDFMIGKYPVTNEEFKGFVDDGGYDRKEFWTREGWRWREENEIYEPDYWHDRKWNGPNFPVVGISWYETEAYANWLSERTGHQYRLPTEAEWEKAARGTDGFKYPWGEDFDKNLCNTNESGLLRTSPVGIFTKGKSPYGCFDMAGNVWEWCSDWYDADYYANSPDRNPGGPSDGAIRVFRGGSWGNAARGCRSAIRGNHSAPRNRGRHLGFRLMRGV